MIGARPAHCRQLGHRARERIAAGAPRFSAAPAQVERVTREFIRACTEGDMHGLLALFASDITIWTDGGGKTAAARNPIRGADRVARFHLGIMRKASGPMTFRVAWVNGRIGIVVSLAGQLNRVCTFDLDGEGRIRALYCVLNPDKLRGVLFDRPQT